MQTQAAWFGVRLASPADVLAAYRDVIAIEDDPFAVLCYTRRGSLLADARLELSTIYVRSFSKSIGPDLRTGGGATPAS